ncbi:MULTISPECIES: hypothetical protein [unclassified Frankia]|nr:MULTISPECIES: hypothetical protein [unclassified Frankia]
MVGQGGDQRVPAGAGADLGEHDQVGLLLRGDPCRLPTSAGGGRRAGR